MRVRWVCGFALAVLCCEMARPDTITLKDNLSINGSLAGMSNGVVTIKARFSSGEKEMSIAIKYVQSIEFNLLTNNLGAPPEVLGIGPPQPQNTPGKEPPTGDVIVIRGGERRPCVLVRIDADRVHCDPNDATYNRGVVLRVVFGSK
jgi:hypothetical protein